MKVLDINPISSPHWVQLINENNSDVFHTPDWLNVLAKTYEFNIRAKVLLNSADIPIAGLLYIEINDMLSPRIVSIPFSDYCDPIINNIDEWKKLSQKIIDKKKSISIRCLHNEIPHNDNRFKLVNKARWHGINLIPDIEELHKNMKSSSKRAIRKAQREGISIRISQSENDLRAFYEMHLNIRKKKYRLLTQSYSFFKNIWRNFIKTDQAVLMLAEHENQVIAGVLYLKWKNRLYYKFNASVTADLNLRPNDLIMWEGIKYAKENNFNYLDLGLSDWEQEGLIHYKRKYASEEKTISFLRYTPLDSSNEKDKQFRDILHQLTDLFTKDSVSNEVTEQAGDILYQYFV